MSFLSRVRITDHPDVGTNLFEYAPLIFSFVPKIPLRMGHGMGHGNGTRNGTSIETGIPAYDFAVRGSNTS